MQSLVYQYQNQPITFYLNGEVMVNATQMAKPFNKVPNEFLRLPSTLEYLEALESNTGKSRLDLVKTSHGGSNPGTWFCQKLTIRFAQWLSPVFSVWVDSRIEELLQTGKTEVPSMSEAEMRLHVFKQLEQEAESLKEQNRLLAHTIKVQAPKAEYCDKVLQSEGTHPTTIIAKELGMSATSLNRRLRELGVQYQRSGTWVLSAKYQAKGYTDTKTFPYYDSNNNLKTSIQTVWTESGRQFIHSLFHQNNKAA